MTGPAPGDLCTCGHSRNQHDRYGGGRCLLRGCTGTAGASDDDPRIPCERLTPPAELEHRPLEVAAAGAVAAAARGVAALGAALAPVRPTPAPRRAPRPEPVTASAGLW